jgi:glycerol-1-phosphatase
MALADQFDGFLVDLDGVVWVGREMVTGAAEALRSLIEGGKEVVFVTNNPGRPPSTYAERLRQAGVPTADNRVVTAGVVTARLAAERVGEGAGTFVSGAPGLKEAAREAGLELLDGDAGRGADAVLVSGHRDFDYEELLTATLALQSGASLFATSRDPTLPMPGGAWPGTGAILAAVETASGKTA